MVKETNYERIYYEEGPASLLEEHRGCGSSMAKKKNNNKNTLNKEIKEDLVAERIKCKLKGLSPVQYRMQSSRVA